MLCTKELNLFSTFFFTMKKKVEILEKNICVHYYGKTSNANSKNHILDMLNEIGSSK